jgi:exodeoxyribonuclease X
MPAIRIFDVETTGLDPTDHRVIEIAAYDLREDNSIVPVASHLVAPGRDIPPEASAVHHLILQDLAGVPAFDTAWATYLPDAPIYYAAHNCDFEQKFIPTPNGTRWLCTHKCSLRAWPQAPAHSNQVLRYWRALDTQAGFDRQLAAQPHRAAPDAYVTAWLLRLLLQQFDIETLLAWSAEPKVYPRLSFGKHRGQTWAEIPPDYLFWLRDGQHTMDPDWRHGANLELTRRTLA